MPVVAGLAPLAGVVIAAAVMLMVWAASIILLEPIKFLLRQLPFIGSEIAKAVGALGDWVANAAADQLQRQVQGFTDLVDFVTGTIQGVLDAITDGIEILFGAIHGLQLMMQGIQRLAQQSLNDLSRDVDRAIRDATRGLTRIAAVAADLASALANAIPRMIDQAVAGVRSWVRGIERDLQRLIDDAVGALRATIVGMIASQLAGIRSWVSSLITQTQQALQGVERQLWDGVRTLEHELGHRLDGLARDLEGLQRQIGVIPLIGLVPWIQTIADTLTKVTTECVRPSCNYLGPQLDALNAVQDAATLAIVAGLVAAAVSDPEGAARNLDHVLSGADDLARDVFRSTTGVRV